MVKTFRDQVHLPEWSNPFCYWYRTPKHTDRLVSWEEITKKFHLQSTQSPTLEKIYNRTNYHGWINFAQINKIIPQKNRSRALKSLCERDVLSKRCGGYYLNPSILWARDWWSPYMQGVLVQSYIYSIHVEAPPISKFHIVSSASMERGCQWARYHYICEEIRQAEVA